MKLLTSLSFAILFSSQAISQFNASYDFFNGDYDKQYIRQHNIKSIRVADFISNTEAGYKVFQFDTAGLLIDEVIFDKDGKRVTTFSFVFNHHGDLTERRSLAEDSTVLYTYTFQREYADSGTVFERSGDVPYLVKYIYDKINCKTAKIIYTNADTLKGEKQIEYYKYDSNKRLIAVEKVFVEESGKAGVIEMNLFTYDKHKIIITKKERLTSYSYFFFNKEGLLESTTNKLSGEFNKLETQEKYSYTFWN
jgi:hypothetical protein